MNYINYDIDTLVEMLESITDAEKDQIIQEIVYRYRKGIGVDTDHEEADRWEQQLSIQSAGEEVVEQGQEQEQEPTDHILSDNGKQGYYQNLSPGRLFNKYREGDPWAAYYVAVQWGEKGEVDNALNELIMLSENIEYQMHSTTMTEEIHQLLAMIKTQMGRMYNKKYENAPKSFGYRSNINEDLSADLLNARNSFEIAALELGYSPALPYLVENYKVDGLSRHVDKIMSPLRRMERGSVEDQLFAAITYSEVGYKARAAGIYQSLLEEVDLTVEQRIDISCKLIDLDEQFADSINMRSAENDDIAMLVLARKMVGNNRLSEAFDLYDAINSENSFIVECCMAEKVSALDMILTDPVNHHGSPEFYKSLLNREELNTEQRIAITNELVRQGEYTKEALMTRSSGGDSLATIALAHLMLKNSDFDGAYRHFELAETQDVELKEYCDVQLQLVLNALAKKREEFFFKQQREKEWQELEQKRATLLLEEERDARRAKRKERWERVFDWAKRHLYITGIVLFIGVVSIAELISGISSVFESVGADRIDAFEEIQVDFYGIDPYGKVRILNFSDNPFLQAIEYEISSEEKVRNDSKVTITANYSEKLAKEYNYKLKDTTKVYTVKNLPYYVYEATELTKDDKNKLDLKALECLDKYLTEASCKILAADADVDYNYRGEWESEYTKVDQKSAYFQALRPDNSGSFYNRYLAFFKVKLNLKCDGKQLYNDEVYYAVSFYNIVINNSSASLDSDVISTEKIVAAANKTDIVEVQAEVIDVANSLDDLYEQQVSDYMTRYITTK